MIDLACPHCGHAITTDETCVKHRDLAMCVNCEKWSMLSFRLVEPDDAARRRIASDDKCRRIEDLWRSRRGAPN